MESYLTRQMSDSTPPAPPTPTCPRCGAPLASDAPEGLCPRCLGALPLEAETVLTGVSTAAAQPLTPKELGPCFPNLQILECLGRGGMGVVYKARQKTLNRLVALKLLAPERVADTKFAARFAHEAQALAAMNHPNIVTVYDFGQAGGFYFLLMEYVDGANLRQLLRHQKFTPEEALAIVPTICAALQYAHDCGIVHRDIKPENLLLDKEGRVKIADFGIARMLNAEAPDIGPAESQPAGTPQYMAPEQAAHRSADHRADIYSLGVVFYEMLTGELPGKPIEAPSARMGGLRVEVRLDEIVLRALEANPERRYQTAGEFRVEMETISSAAVPGAAAAGAAEPAHPPTAPETNRRESDPSHFSRTAIVAAAWITLSLLVVPPFLWHEVNSHEFEIGGPFSNALTVCVTLFILVPAFAAPLGATLLGWVAVSQLRRSAGKLYGMWLAVFDGLFFPLLICDAVLALLCLGAVQGASMYRWMVNPKLAWLLLTATTCPLVDYAVVRSVWSAVNGERVRRWIAILLWVIGIIGAILLVAVALLGGFYVQKRESPSTPGAPATVAAPTPPFTPGHSLALGNISEVQIEEMDDSRRIVLKFPVKQLSSDTIQAEAVQVRVDIYDRKTDGSIVRSDSGYSSHLMPLPVNFTDDIEVLEVDCSYPAPGAGNGPRDQSYYGYVASVYYNGALEDRAARPQWLIEKFAPPRLLSVPKFATTAPSTPAPGPAGSPGRPDFSKDLALGPAIDRVLNPKDPNSRALNLTSGNFVTPAPGSTLDFGPNGVDTLRAGGADLVLPDGAPPGALKGLDMGMCFESYPQAGGAGPTIDMITAAELFQTLAKMESWQFDTSPGLGLRLPMPLATISGTNLCVFETRNGIRGALQITGVNQNPSTIKVRYRLLQPATGVRAPGSIPMNPKADIILPGEKLKIFVVEDSSFNGVYMVRRGGYIIMPAVGRIPVTGKTVPEAEQAISAALEETQLARATVMVERLGGPDDDLNPGPPFPSPPSILFNPHGVLQIAAPSPGATPVLSGTQ